MGTLNVDYCTDSREHEGEVCGIPFISRDEMMKREDLFVYITVYEYYAARAIHDYLTKHKIPHKMFMDGE